MLLGFRMEEKLAAPGIAHSLTPTSKELLLPSKTLALLITDLPPVVRGDLLHGQLQVLLLLGQEVPVLGGREEDRPLAPGPASQHPLLLQKKSPHDQRRKHTQGKSKT